MWMGRGVVGSVLDPGRGLAGRWGDSSGPGRPRPFPAGRAVPGPGGSGGNDGPDAGPMSVPLAGRRIGMIDADGRGYADQGHRPGRSPGAGSAGSGPGRWGSRGPSGWSRLTQDPMWETTSRCVPVRPPASRLHPTFDALGPLRGSRKCNPVRLAHDDILEDHSLPLRSFCGRRSASCWVAAWPRSPRKPARLLVADARRRPMRWVWASPEG